MSAEDKALDGRGYRPKAGERAYPTGAIRVAWEMSYQAQRQGRPSLLWLDAEARVCLDAREAPEPLLLAWRERQHLRWVPLHRMLARGVS